MSKNRKKIIGTLLGLMASVSSAGAVKNAPSASNADTETAAKSKKRSQNTTSVYWNIARLFVSGLAANEVGSNLPVIKHFTYPLLRQLSGYRVRFGTVRGEFRRSNGLIKIGNSFNYKVFNESDGEFYCLTFSPSLQYYKVLDNQLVLKPHFKKIEDVKYINEIKNKKNLVINPTPNGATLIRLSMESDDGTVLNKSVPDFLKSDDFSVSDAADALNKAIEFVKLINSYKANEEKLRLINENFDAVYAPKLNKDEIKNMDKNDIVTANKALRMFRIFVKERKNTKGEMRKIYAEFPLIEEDEIEQQA